MSWYYKTAGIHVHVRAFVSGVLVGTLVFRLGEFADILLEGTRCGLIKFVKE